MPKTYVALVSEDQTIVEFNEWYDDEQDAKNRARVLELEGAGRPGEWSVYFGAVPIEAAIATEEWVKDNPLKINVTEDEIAAWQNKQQAFTLGAAAKTKAVKGEPPIDDRVETRSCHACSKPYVMDLDWCPACGARPPHPQSVLDANAELQALARETDKANIERAIEEGGPLLIERLITEAQTNRKNMDYLVEKLGPEKVAELIAASGRAPKEEKKK